MLDIIKYIYEKIPYNLSKKMIEIFRLNPFTSLPSTLGSQATTLYPLSLNISAISIAGDSLKSSISGL